MSFLNKKENNLSLVLDIQSGLIRGSLVVFGLDIKPHIIFNYTKHISLDKGQGNGGPYMTKVMLKTLNDVLTTIQKNGLTRAKTLGYKNGNIHEIFYALSSPWAVSHAQKIRADYKKETVINEKVIEEIIHDESKLLMNEFILDLQKNKSSNLDIILFEKKIFDIRLNGYSVNNYSGKKTSVLEVSFAITVASKNILNKIISEVGKIFHVKHEYFHGSLLLHYLALRSLSPNRDEYTSLHVHGELTDIVIVNKGSGVFLASFPFGAYTLVRKIAKSMRISPENVKSMLSLYEEDKLEDKKRSDFEEVLNEVLQGWKRDLVETLNSREGVSIPHIIYLSIHEHFKLFEKAIKESDFEVVHFDDSLVDEAVSFERPEERSWLMGMYVRAIKDVNKDKK